MVPSLAEINKVPKETHANIQNPEDKPSTPSIIFMALMIPTLPTIQRGADRYTGSFSIPNKP